MVQLRWQISASLVVFFFGLFFIKPSFGQNKNLKPILDRLQRIERDIKTLNIQVSRGDAVGVAGTGSSAAARAAVRLTDLEDELRATTGRVETVAQKIEDIGLRLDQLIADLDYRLSALEHSSPGSQQDIKASPSPGGPQQVFPGSSMPGVLGVISKPRNSNFSQEDGEDKNISKAPAGGDESTSNMVEEVTQVLKILPKGTTVERYTFAVGLLRQGDYEQAEKAFNEFMVAHPDDNLLDNARYWLAESYYVRGQYLKAAEFFMNGYQANASAAKAPDMLLKLGMSLSKLNKNKDACASFAKLVDDYPKVSKRILKKVRLESKNIGCK